MTRIYILLALVVALLSGCSYRHDVSSASAYQGFAKMSMKTAKPLRLYGAGFDLVKAKGRFDLTTVDQGPAYLIGTVPVGAVITNQRVIEFHDIGGSWQEIWGDVTYKGTIYPFRHYMGTHGLKRMFDIFQPSDGQTWNQKPET